MEKTVVRGAIYFADLKDFGNSVQHGLRPVVVVSNDSANRYSTIISVVSMTTKMTKHNLPTHVHLSASESGMKDSICLCEQPLSISKNDLQQYVTTLSSSTMQRISNGLKIQLAL